ncbi:hypothetical protein F5878DRAFT_701583 [Lentinula raphanica]|uniref:Uncharacterized protein n=1 Tax=Lentinula raphanica TaxID=153919 RepID=A0AA38PFK7_9AGAR|nr:hypothetical protein F5878DRAFT_701583 [Lentinula raphanica]
MPHSRTKKRDVLESQKAANAIPPLGPGGLKIVGEDKTITSPQRAADLSKSKLYPNDLPTAGPSSSSQTDPSSSLVNDESTTKTDGPLAEGLVQNLPALNPTSTQDAPLELKGAQDVVHRQVNPAPPRLIVPPPATLSLLLPAPAGFSQKTDTSSMGSTAQGGGPDEKRKQGDRLEVGETVAETGESTISPPAVALPTAPASQPAPDTSQSLSAAPAPPAVLTPTSPSTTGTTTTITTGSTSSSSSTSTSLNSSSTPAIPPRKTRSVTRKEAGTSKQDALSQGIRGGKRKHEREDTAEILEQLPGKKKSKYWYYVEVESSPELEQPNGETVDESARAARL